MLEFAIRLGLTLTLLAGAGATGLIKTSYIAPTGIGAFAISAFALALSQAHGIPVAKRRANMNLLACLDTCFVASAISIAHLLPTWGWLAAVGGVIGVLRGANPNLLAPIVAGSIVVGAGLNLGSGPYPTECLLQALFGAIPFAILSGNHEYLVSLRRIAKLSELPEETPEEDDLLFTRERYRQTCEKLARAERQAQKLSRIAEFQNLRGLPHDKVIPTLLYKLKELAEVSHVELYTISTTQGVACLRTYSGKRKVAGIAKSIPIDTSLMANVTDQIGEAIRAQSPVEPPVNIPLVHAGRSIGLLALYGDDVDREPLRKLGEQVGSVIAEIIGENDERVAIAARAKQAEFLYDLAVVERGEQTPHEVCQAVIAELASLYRLDQISICAFTNGELRIDCTTASTETFVTSLRFDNALGLGGWISNGVPDIWIKDTQSPESPCDATAASRHRIGSYLLLPLVVGSSLFGTLELWSSAGGSITEPMIDSAKMVAQEACRAIERLLGQSQPQLLKEQEFAVRFKNSKNGHFVILEILKRGQIVDQIGRPALRHVHRKLKFRLLSKLPSGGFMCAQKSEGFLAYLPTENLTEAESWANDAVTTASLLGIQSETGSHRIPVALRAKVAPCLQRSETEEKEEINS